MPELSQFNIDRTCPGRWTITFSNPPINMFLPTTIDELRTVMTELEADPSLKVVVFQSANPDFFVAHLDVAKAAERPEALSLWRDFVLRLSSTPVVSIAKIRGRTRGIGNEFVLACDMRFASRKTALFGQPEIGVGLVPGGGALEWLPRLVGRSRALEIVLSGDDFDAEIAERYGWINRSLDDDDLDSFVDTLAGRLASFDRETLAAAKTQVNRVGKPTADELQSSNDLFFPLLASHGAQARRAQVRNLGYGVRSDFELNFGRYLPAFGRADDDDPDTAKARETNAAQRSNKSFDGTYRWGRNMKLAKNTICLWYDGDAEDAARFYAETFPDSSVGRVLRAPGDFPSGRLGDVLTVEFIVMGIPCLGLNGGPTFTHNEAFSFQVATDDQAETDRYWNAIVGNGGEESACGWCKDKWGVSWQITPTALTNAITDPDRATAKRAFDAMMQMKKIDIAAIEAATRG